MSFTVQDANENEIRVGSRVRVFDSEVPGTVTAISEPDADYDDELGRGVEYPPRVTVAFDEGGEDKFTTYTRVRGWGDYMNDDIPYTSDDLERI